MSQRYLRAVRLWQGKWSRRAFWSQSERKSFGSFHAEDVEVLIRMRDDEFQVPSVHSAIQEAVLDKFHLNHSHSLPMQDPDFRESLFALDREWTFLNHGAFGATLRPLLFETFLWREYCDSQPLRFFDRELFPLVVHSLRQMAAHLHCAPVDLLPLSNVTAGLNAVFSTMEGKLNRNDEVVHFSVTYGATKRMIGDLCQRTGAKNTQIEIPFPLHSPEQILCHLRDQLSPRTRLVVLDSITSNTAIAQPWLEMARLCKQVNPSCVVVVDAAHSLFSQSIDLGEDAVVQSVDYFVTNGHKWLSAPKGCAVLWANPRLVRHLRPPRISHGFSPSLHLPACLDRSHFLSGFLWQGCQDYTALVSLPTALSLWSQLAAHLPPCPSSSGQGEEGGAVWSSRCQGESRDGWTGLRRMTESLLDEADAVLQDAWRLQPEDYLVASEEWRRASPMRLIPLPRKLQGRDTRSGCTDKEAFQLQEKLHADYAIEVPVKCLAGGLHVRLSGHVYNRLEDFQKLALVLRNWSN